MMANAPSFGVHLPVRTLPGVDQTPPTAAHHSDMVAAAANGGFGSVWVTDHIVYADPWMDCMLLLASVANQAKDAGMAVATGVVGLPLRHPVAMAQTYATLDVLSGGNLIAGVGEGSTKSDFDALGLPFDERRKMLEDGVVALRKLLSGDSVSHEGPYYSFQDVAIAPAPLQKPSPPIWLSSWGSAIGVKRVARLADGWVASAWHATPEEFADGLARLNDALAGQGKDPASFPNAVDTMFFYVDSDRSRAHSVGGAMVETATRQPFDANSGHYLVGDYDECAELVQRWTDAGARTVCVWPLADDVEQVRRFGEHVIARLR